MFHSRTLRIVTLAAAILAFSASAAQARPLGLGYTDHSQSQAGDVLVISSAQSAHHGFGDGPARTPQLGTQTISRAALHGYQGPLAATLARARGVEIMSPSVDPANAQQVPVVVTQAQPIAATDSGFNWTNAILGAAIASVVLLLAGATASRIRPRRVAQL